MTVTREQIVAEAREWLGTRWQHQASVKGLAADCIGLVRGVALNLGLLNDPEQLRPWMDYGRIPDGAKLRQGLDRFMQPVDPAQSMLGDVLLMRFERQPQHVAIVTDVGIIHAYAAARRVVEHGLDAQWRSRIVGAYRWPGVVA